MGTKNTTTKDIRKQMIQLVLNDIQQGAKAYFDTIRDFGKQTQDAVITSI